MKAKYALGGPDIKKRLTSFVLVATASLLGGLLLLTLAQPAAAQQEPPQPEKPGPVTSMELSATTDSVTVSWDAPESGGTPNRYIVHLKPKDSGKGKTKRPRASRLSVTFENLEAGKIYNVWVRAQNEGGKGERVHATATLPVAEPKVIPQPQEPPGAETVQLQQQRSTSTRDIVWSATLTIYEDPSGAFLGCDNVNRYKVLAYFWPNGSTCGENLSHTSFKHNGKTYYITRFYLGPDLRLFLSADDLYTIHHDTNLHDLALRVGDDAFLSIIDGLQVSGKSATWEDPGLNWTSGQEVSVSLETLSPAPTNVTITPGDEKLDLSWTPPVNTTVTGYEVRYYYRSPGSRGADWIDAGHTGTDPEHRMTGLTNGAIYSVQVRAKHSDGHSAWSFPRGSTFFYIGFEGTPVGPPP